MDRNEVLLVGRLSAAAEDKTLPGGDTLTKWRLIIRRKRHKRGGTAIDSIPCVTFDPAVAAVIHTMKPRDPLEIAGALRLRVYGPVTAKIFNYEVEVEAATALDPTTLPPPPEPNTSKREASTTPAGATPTVPDGAPPTTPGPGIPTTTPKGEAPTTAPNGQAPTTSGGAVPTTSEGAVPTTPEGAVPTTAPEEEVPTTPGRAAPTITSEGEAPTSPTPERKAGIRSIRQLIHR